MEKCKQKSSFYVKTVLCNNGERLPTLINAKNGIPDFDSTLWVLSALRMRGFASATIEQALRSLIVLYKVFEQQNISLKKRFEENLFITPLECISIVNAAKIKSNVRYSTAPSEPKQFSEFRKTKNLEKLRYKIQIANQQNYVNSSTTAIRLFYIRSFLYWRITKEIHRSSIPQKNQLVELRSTIDTELRNQTPLNCGRVTIGIREGLSAESLRILQQIILIDAPRNPWTNSFVKIRNRVIVSLCIGLGIRRGELLGLRINDLKPQLQEIHILRRPDDILDPRIFEPNTKTRDRVLSLHEELYESIKLYLHHRHSLVKGKHSFLLVANNGNPLSKSGLNRVFMQLQKLPEFAHLSPHILRHTFFEHLAEELYKAGVSENETLVFLRQQGGWSDNSDSPRIYTKRFVRETANKALASLQDKLIMNQPVLENEK